MNQESKRNNHMIFSTKSEKTSDNILDAFVIKSQLANNKREPPQPDREHLQNIPSKDWKNYEEKKIIPNPNFNTCFKS